MKLQREYTKKIVRLFPAAVVAFMVMTDLPVVGVEGQKTFSSPQEAVDCLVTAVRAGSETELLAIFGSDSEDLISSGDPVADRSGRARFLKAYGDKHIIEQEGNAKAVLSVGTKDYPLPIPLVRKADVWFFDTKAGMEEILDRRIGRNELHTIEVLQAYTDAQREYACRKHIDGADTEFAQKLISSAGKKDGLYWEAKEGEEESPFGPLIARATQEGYQTELAEENPEPFHGYYFKILRAQGEHAEGGAFDYVAGGKMILGFGLVAYPANYGVTGIMTFIVNQEGMVYQKDLGEDTPKAANMELFEPDNTWKISEEAPEGEGQNNDRGGGK